ncbi:VOC family protein [Deinococcus budaensis]|uniref:Catechol 2,3-dioxygenase-like lactoylglutathione lyase family enzyme n=1 Tax=Deinococcus budaensis TaxID=1665626 RepID=A0A7W8GJ84_9DEIO|nr:VOC family protein [Deinococcus budaensis]MBB5236309.1 catechol 2,3-dioxygenase-like lactoylglutathione lyase family enzyme [Deinococcus budaensis]
MTNPESPAPVRMDGLSLPVANVPASVAFYTRLGFTVELTDPSGQGFALLRIGGGTVGLQRRKGEDAPRVRDGIHVELSTEDLDGLYAWMQASEIAVEKPPHDRPWERVMVLRDPDGFRVEFSQGERGHNRPR